MRSVSSQIRRVNARSSSPTALALIREVRPVRAVLTNLHTDLDYAALAARLPEGIVPAYDGMSLTLTA